MTSEQRAALIALKEKRGWTYRHLADRLGISLKTLERYLGGASPGKNSRGISAMLRVTELLNDNDDQRITCYVAFTLGEFTTSTASREGIILPISERETARLNCWKAASLCIREYVDHLSHSLSEDREREYLPSPDYIYCWLLNHWSFQRGWINLD